MSNSSDDGEDYWPGYVDALTSMVQVLAFVMMLLAVTIFVLSKNVSKGAIEQIAKSANVPVTPTSTVKELTEKIKEELSRPRVEAKIETPPKPEEPARTAAPEPDEKSHRPEDKVQRPDAPASAPATAVASSGDAPSEGKKVTAINTSERRAAPSTLKASEQAEPPPDAKHIVLTFSERSYRIERAAAEAVAGFVAGENLAGSKARILIRAYASNATGAVTEGRRIAYYRAMVARQELKGHKIPPASISIRIIDTSDPERGGRIELYAVPEGAP